MPESLAVRPGYQVDVIARAIVRSVLGAIQCFFASYPHFNFSADEPTCQGRMKAEPSSILLNKRK